MVPGTNWTFYVGVDKTDAVAAGKRLEHRQLGIILGGLLTILLASCSSTGVSRDHPGAGTRPHKRQPRTARHRPGGGPGRDRRAGQRDQRPHLVANEEMLERGERRSRSACSPRSSSRRGTRSSAGLSTERSRAGTPVRSGCTATPRSRPSAGSSPSSCRPIVRRRARGDTRGLERGEAIDGMETVGICENGDSIDVLAHDLTDRAPSGEIVGASTIARDMEAHTRRAGPEALRGELPSALRTAPGTDVVVRPRKRFASSP